MTTRTKRPLAPPSAKKKTPPRGSQTAKPRRKSATASRAYLARLARMDADAAALRHEIVSAPDHPAVITAAEELAGLRPPPRRTPEEADAAQRRAFRYRVEELLETLRDGLEPDPATLPALAQIADRAAAILRDAATRPEAAAFLADALLPAACAAVTLADFVNGPCRERAPQAHAAARANSERWPRIHHASPAGNAQEEATLRENPLGRRPAKQIRKDRAHPAAFEATLKAMRQLLPDALRPGGFPVFPMLLSADGQPIPPRTPDDDRLAEPYLALAFFLVTMRHTPKKATATREKALCTFLAANDAALDALPRSIARTVRPSYSRFCEYLRQCVRDLHNKPALRRIPAWLLPASPVLDTPRASWSKTLDAILPDKPHRRPVLADALSPVYARALADAHRQGK